MANKNFQKKKIQETAGSGFGQYQEGVGGGGSPQVKDPNKRAPGVNSTYRKENNDTNQPRTNDGKFTYKSVNGKSIDPKYGPSRGKTVNPLLTGGQNGIEISDVEQQFASKSGAYWNKYKDSWYQKGGEIVTTDLKTRVAADAIWNVAKRRYDSVKGEFSREGSTFAETKKGRSSAEEKAAKQKAQASGEEQAVIEQSSGGIKLKPGTPAPIINKPVAPQPGAGIGTTPVVPTGAGNAPVVNTATASDIANADYTPKYDDNDIAQARAVLQEAGFSDDELAGFDAMSPKEKDEYIDKYFDVDDDSNEGGDEGSNEGGDEAQAQETQVEETKTENKVEDEDSETVKKIKNMGFSN